MITVHSVNLLHVILVYHGAILAGVLIWRVRFWALSALIAAFSVHMALNFFSETGLWIAGDGVAQTFGALYGPLFFLTVKGLVEARAQGGVNWRDGLHLLPWLGLLILAPPLIVMRLVSLLSLVGYVGWAFFLAWRYHTQMCQLRADAESLRLDWLLSIIIAFALISAMDGLRMVLSANGLNDAGALSYGLSLTIAFICLNVIAYFAYQHVRRHGPEAVAVPPAPGLNTAQTSTLDEAAIRDHFIQIDAVMRDEEPWREPALRLDQLAKRVRLSPRDTSHAINRHAGCSFVRYINRARVAAIIARLEGEPSTTLMAMAFDAGFNSKAAFNRVFKDETGLSPSAYLAQRA
ncbi:helix-turn-helix domain-containing protein [Woodsholea maritima]|uniref:helix-turn-helix domain-containing protein n=1 Tax=Woodsholea maritima TaxID=240237 RepID=UPI0003689A14|nr:helix-turn-helix domain-containing protein [Woodsholea maritima]